MIRTKLILLCLFCGLGILTAQPLTDIFLAHYQGNYDGDTFKAAIELPAMYGDFQVYTTSVRLYLTDTDEMNSSDPVKRIKALLAKELTKKMLSVRTFYVHYFGKDRFGRWLCKVYFSDGKTLRDYLLGAGLVTGKYEDRRWHKKRPDFSDKN